LWYNGKNGNVRYIPEVAEMKSLQLQTEIGPDGVLDLRVSLGKSEANLPVVVTIQPVPSKVREPSQEQDVWQAFVERTYGSCVGLGLEEPEDLPLPTYNG
jgi:hypothetical protein